MVGTGGAVAAADLVPLFLISDAGNGGGSRFFQQTIVMMQMGNAPTECLISSIEYGLLEGGIMVKIGELVLEGKKSVPESTIGTPLKLILKVLKRYSAHNT